MSRRRGVYMRVEHNCLFISMFLNFSPKLSMYVGRHAYVRMCVYARIHV